MNVRYDGPVEPSEEVVLSEQFEIAVLKEEAAKVEPAAPKERKLIAAAQEQGMMHYSVNGISKVL